MTMSTTPLETAPDALRLSSTELHAWRGMLQVHQQLMRSLDAQLQAEHGLPVSSYEVLMFIADAEEERLRMCDLADSVLLSRSGLTRLVDRLAKDGLVEREPCPDDARGAFATLTPRGREVLDAARATHLGGVRELFLAHLSHDEQETLGTLWERVLGREG
jgi:DNA-binding MarR family transcriptional regulator